MPLALYKLPSPLSSDPQCLFIHLHSSPTSPLSPKLLTPTPTFIYTTLFCLKWSTHFCLSKSHPSGKTQFRYFCFPKSFRPHTFLFPRKPVCLSTKAGWGLDSSVAIFLRCLQVRTEYTPRTTVSEAEDCCVHRSLGTPSRCTAVSVQGQLRVCSCMCTRVCTCAHGCMCLC